ncbi:heat shock factor family protein, partial [Ascoidea rubescens DSM 1968]
RPAFVMKLWSMVNDPKNSDYIQWTNDGKAFKVFDRESFMKNILPKYFKHNNFASFVRQLNMYGWHKVQDIANGNRISTVENEIWQFES